MRFVGHEAPHFSCQALVNGVEKTVKLEDLAGSYTVLFFYPLDFTFVCPTEMHALQAKIEEFKKRDCQVYGISIDSIHAHRAWLETPKKQGGIQGISYPLISDIHRTLARSFDVLDEEEGVALRGVFILDKDNIVQHELVNNLPLGRNIDEIIRTLDAIQFVDKHGDQVCPANWTEGEETMSPDQTGLDTYFGK